MVFLVNGASELEAMAPPQRIPGLEDKATSAFCIVEPHVDAFVSDRRSLRHALSTRGHSYEFWYSYISVSQVCGYCCL
jgi:hypothetical protein